ncbi:MAG: serine protease [candidate division Zixibacteria bacterium]|nr:serine protease [candidate division Zixibacteria bacterium]
MRTSLVGAVGKSITIIFSAVFFAGAAQAGDAPLQQLEAGLSNLIYRLSRSIVTVEATRPIPGMIPGSNGLLIQSSVSTGLVYDSLGHILVAAESISGYGQIQVTGEDRSVPAKVVAVDYKNNIALLMPDIPVGAPVTIGEPSVCAGQMVLALANAYGLRASPSVGFCAGLRPDGSLQFSLPTLSSAAGGGVFDLSGNLIGLVTGDLGNPSRIALAFPARKLPGVVEYLLNHGSRLVGFIGVASRSIVIDPPTNGGGGGPVVPAGIRSDHMPDRAVVVVNVMPSSPASQAGIQPGDLILELGGRTVSGSGDLAALVADLVPGQTIPVKLVRRGMVVIARVQIGRRPSQLSIPQLSGRTGRDRATDSLFRLLERLKEEMSRVEQRLQLID